VLECACGTGAISVEIAKICSSLIATDFSESMLKRAEKKLSNNTNTSFAIADITKLGYADKTFDAVVAGNVIHLLSEPKNALDELLRVCKTGGKIIIPTYINKSKKSSRFAVKIFELFGADFKKQFDFESYQDFFADIGYKNVEYAVVDGRMPCAIAVIKKYSD